MDGVWGPKSEGVWLIVRTISFQDFQPMWSQSTNVTDGRTDRRTPCNPNTALCTIVHRTVNTSSLDSTFPRKWLHEASTSMIFDCQHTFYKWLQIQNNCHKGSIRTAICTHYSHRKIQTDSKIKSINLSTNSNSKTLHNAAECTKIWSFNQHKTVNVTNIHMSRYFLSHVTLKHEFFTRSIHTPLAWRLRFVGNNIKLVLGWIEQRIRLPIYR